jgi:uncharacterized protein (TIGR00255 family)
MIRSMTAFARCDTDTKWGALSWELRSVNHRYLEASLRLPDDLRLLEPKIRQLLSSRLARGKLDCSLRLQINTDAAAGLSINEALARQLVDASREIDHMLYNPSPVDSMDILRWPGVIEAAGIDWEQLREQTVALLDTALDELVAIREREGASLRTMIIERLDAMQEIVGNVRTRLPEIIALQRQKIISKLAELDVQLDEGRLEQEAALLMQKLDVDEEMDRLATHIDEVRRNLEGDKPVGRRLDFLMQEMNREANTLGSKSIDMDTTRASVDLKVFIEQMREQIQNIE